VASDATPSLLRRRWFPDTERTSLAGANVYHLPFRDRIFAVATLVRVFGFLTDPGAALREIHRVLCPGGLLVLSFEPHPTVSSFVDDLKVSFAPSRRGPVKPMTFSRESVVPVRPSSYPAWSHTRAHVGELAEASGFVLEMEYPCGLEDFAGLRRLPASVFLSLGQAFSHLGGFPTRFVALRKVA
jgi:SAM-dependent methyltransferase